MEKIRVLMIDDNVALTEMVKEYFKNHKKIEVTHCCYNGTDGLNAIVEKEGEYDIVLLDLIMPKKDGIAVLEELKKKNISRNIIVETSYNRWIKNQLIYFIIIWRFLLRECCMNLECLLILKDINIFEMEL